MIYGTIAISGYAEDSAVTVEHDEDDWELAVGVDGEGTRSKSSNLSATITVALMQSAAVNDLLSAERLLDINTPGGTGGKELIIKDNSGTSLFQAETAWIQKAPTGEFNRSPNAREWVFRTDLLNATHGSN
jgi:hypothetical protein